MSIIVIPPCATTAEASLQRPLRRVCVGCIIVSSDEGLRENCRLVVVGRQSCLRPVDIASHKQSDFEEQECLGVLQCSFWLLWVIYLRQLAISRCSRNCNSTLLMLTVFLPLGFHSVINLVTPRDVGCSSNFLIHRNYAMERAKAFLDWFAKLDELLLQCWKSSQKRQM